MPLDGDVIQPSVRPEIDDYGLKKMIFKLKDEQRLLIDLSYFQGFTHEQIATALHTPIGHSKNQDTKCINTIKSINAIMNVKEYISSGIVESYVMGLASEAGAAGV